MVTQMKKVAEDSPILSTEERNLLSVAYKNVIGQRRAAWRILSTIKTKEEENGADRKKTCDDYISQVEQELKTICTDVLNVLAKLIENVPQEDTEANHEAKVFYQKM